MHEDFQPVPGSELRRQRLALGAQEQEVAHLMGVSRTTIWRIEHKPAVPVITAGEYREALAKIAVREGVR